MSDEYVVNNFHMVPDKCLFHFISVVVSNFLKRCISSLHFCRGMTWKSPGYRCGEINVAPSQGKKVAKKASVADLPEITWLGRTSAKNEEKKKWVILVGKVPLTHRMNMMSGVMFSPFH